MTKVSFSMNSLERSVVPSLNNTIDSMDVLINKCSQLSAPYDFRYKTYLSDLTQACREMKNSVISVRDWVYTSNKKINNLIEEIKYNSVGLDNIQIGRKYSSIK